MTWPCFINNFIRQTRPQTKGQRPICEILSGYFSKYGKKNLYFPVYKVKEINEQLRKAIENHFIKLFKLILDVIYAGT